MSSECELRRSDCRDWQRVVNKKSNLLLQKARRRKPIDAYFTSHTSKLVYLQKKSITFGVVSQSIPVVLLRKRCPIFEHLQFSINISPSPVLLHLNLDTVINMHLTQ
jgi:hypothetical protein